MREIMIDAKLTPFTLAVLGIMDDFYCLYCEIKEVYENYRKIYARNNEEKYPLLSKTWDELCIRDVRKKFEPYMQKYLYLYTSEYDEIFSYAYAFNDFSFIDKDKRTNKFNSKTPFVLGFKSFEAFLYEFQVVITIIDWRKKYVKDSNHTIQKSWEQINHKINNIVKEKLKDCQDVSVEVPSNKDNTLYIFENLQNVSCCRKNHPIVPARYVAVVAKSATKISLPVHYCDCCNKFFIGSKTLSVFEKTFGKLIIEKKDISEMESNFGYFSPESKLHSLGYNVIDGNLNENERANLLVYLVENNLISYAELCATIEQNINIFKNSYRHQLAVAKWKVDLKSIGEYVLKNPQKNNS